MIDGGGKGKPQGIADKSQNGADDQRIGDDAQKQRAQIITAAAFEFFEQQHSHDVEDGDDHGDQHGDDGDIIFAVDIADDRDAQDHIIAAVEALDDDALLSGGRDQLGNEPAQQSEHDHDGDQGEADKAQIEDLAEIRRPHVIKKQERQKTFEAEIIEIFDHRFGQKMNFAKQSTDEDGQKDRQHDV